MRRDVLFAAIYRIRTDLQSSGIAEMFDLMPERIRTGGNSPDKNWPAFSVFQRFSVATSTYGEAEIALLKILDLFDLTLAEYWQRLSIDPEPPAILGMRRNVIWAIRDLPKVLDMIKQDYVEDVKHKPEALPPALVGRQMLTIVIIEEPSQFSSSHRIISALTSVTALYEVVAALEGVLEADLIVLACDSGSDKSFDLLGIAKLVEELRKTILAIWDRCVFHRHTARQQSLQLLAQSLPIIERLDEMKNSGALGAEEAEILKRKAIEATGQFVSAGVITEDMAREGNHYPRMVMRPEPRLIAGPISTPRVAQENPDRSVEMVSLTASELAELKRLAARPSKAVTKPKAKR